MAWFAARGHDVRLLDPFGAVVAADLPPGVTVETLRRGSRLPIGSLLADRRELRRLLARLDSQVLHAQYVRRYGWRAALAGFRPLVVSPWGSDIMGVRGGALRTRLWNRFALRSATLVTVSSEGMRNAAVAAGARPERVELIHHGVDTRQFAPGPRDPELASRLRVAEAAVIVAPRAIRPIYRQETIVEAVGRLVVAGRDLVLVMSARDADPASLAKVHGHAAAAGISDRVRLLDDLPHDAMAAYLRLADVVVSVPERDSFPVTLLEAMACGRPIVASDLPAVTPVLRRVDPTAASLVVPVGDAIAMAGAIERALDLDDATRREMGTRLRAHVLEEADYDANMARMEALYRQLAADR